MATWVFDSSTFRQILEYYMNNVEIAYDKGYRVVDGKVYNKNGYKLKNKISTSGYFYFHIFLNGVGKMVTINVHRLVAFQKYGNKMFDEGIVVRHLDGDKKNNLEENIEIGTRSQNEYDKPFEIVKQSRIKCEITKTTNDLNNVNLIRQRRKDGLSYPELVKEFGLSGIGQAHYIVNHEYKTKK